MFDTTPVAPTLDRLFRELTEGAHHPRGAFILNSGDAGLLASLDRLSAAEASQAVDGGGTIAAHAQHLRYGLSLMNRWARDGGNPFADAHWDDAWRVGAVDDTEWAGIRQGLREEADAWTRVLATSRTAAPVELAGMIASIAHVAYHLGAIRQAARAARGPRQGTFG